MRRTKIAENMKKLQELIPDVDKQANTADMLEDAVEYMKFLMSKIVVRCLLCSMSSNSVFN